MRSILTRGRIAVVVSVVAIVLVLILLYFLGGRTGDSPALSVHDAVRIGAEHMASEYGGATGCNAADFDTTRDVWEVSCEYADPDLCEGDAYSISCGPEAMIPESVLVDDQSAEVYE